MNNQSNPQTLTIRWSTITVGALGICLGMVIGAVGVQHVAMLLPTVVDVPTLHLPNNMRIGIAETGVAALCGEDGLAYKPESFTPSKESPARSWRGIQGVIPMGKPWPKVVNEDGNEAANQPLMPSGGMPVQCIN